MTFFFGAVVPYAAIAIFLIGVAARVWRWARVPVPFRIPTMCGQQKSLAFIKHSKLESPFTTLGVVGRMALEVLLFRSLFRNTRAEMREGPRLTYAENKLLWLGALAFHWSFLFILVRHMRFFFEPIPGCALALEAIDGFFQVGAPVIYATDVMILAALAYLFGRRLLNPQVRYISLFSDYLALVADRRRGRDRRADAVLHEGEHPGGEAAGDGPGDVLARGAGRARVRCSSCT